MTHILVPAIWLIVLIVGLPQLSETIYTPSLPDIAHSLKTQESTVEYTLTIYLFGFAGGTLFWGKFSDKFGRKPGVIAGLLIFIIGCIGCYLSSTIEMLMVWRWVQAFGGSIGSVLGQAICRDAFQGPALSKIYSSIGSALALFPALGPVCGGMIAEQFGWVNIFIFLTLFGFILTILVIAKLPETYQKNPHQALSLGNIFLKLIKDKKVIGFGLIVAGCNGILFSYFAEGSFYFIKGLNLSPSQYGLSFIAVATATMGGGILSRKLQANYSSKEIMGYGLTIITIATSVCSLIAIINHVILRLPTFLMINITLIGQMSIAFGICMATSNALALALVDYKHAIGTASSLFGFFYYCLISAFTFGMGLLHNGTLLPMPLYFLGISLFMMVIKKVLLKD
jgi:Bcr/CflA subfamily drug resistance transporter